MGIPIRYALRLATAGALVCCPAIILSADETLPLLCTENFERGLDRWETSDVGPSVWSIARLEAGDTANHVLRLTRQSDYEPPFRSPHSIALLKDLVVRDFELTLRLQNTRPDAGDHRDLCVFWGYQGPAQFYYVHLVRQSGSTLVSDLYRRSCTPHKDHPPGNVRDTVDRRLAPRENCAHGG